MTEHEIREVIHKWKHYWMNQRQNSKDDFETYFNRAIGIDANMTHHLVRMIFEAQEAESALADHGDSINEGSVNKTEGV